MILLSKLMDWRTLYDETFFDIRNEREREKKQYLDFIIRQLKFVK